MAAESSGPIAGKNMVVNRGKEFLYGRSKACLRVWTEAQPDYEGHLTQQARDLGGCVRTYACKSHLVDAKLDVLKIIAGRIGFLPVDSKFKGNMARAVIFGRGLCGVEVDPVTQQQAAVLRRLAATAIWRETARSAVARSCCCLWSRASGSRK